LSDQAVDVRAAQAYPGLVGLVDQGLAIRLQLDGAELDHGGAAEEPPEPFDDRLDRTVERLAAIAVLRCRMSSDTIMPARSWGVTPRDAVNSAIVAIEFDRAG
jgi:hypothetical protein